jgi:hypothetical protein
MSEMGKPKKGQPFIHDEVPWPKDKAMSSPAVTQGEIEAATEAVFKAAGRDLNRNDSRYLAEAALEAATMARKQECTDGHEAIASVTGAGRADRDALPVTESETFVEDVLRKQLRERIRNATPPASPNVKDDDHQYWRKYPHDKPQAATEMSELARLRLFLEEIAAMGPADEEWDADTLESAVALAKRALAGERAQ